MGVKKEFIDYLFELRGRTQYEIEKIIDHISFRKMRVESGYLYNFYDVNNDEYQKEWVFVPDKIEQIVVGEIERMPNTKIELLKNND